MGPNRQTTYRQAEVETSKSTEQLPVKYRLTICLPGQDSTRTLVVQIRLSAHTKDTRQRNLSLFIFCPVIFFIRKYINH